MCHHTVSIEFPLSSFNDQALADLFTSTTLWHPHVPALSIAVATAAQTEALRRQSNRDNPDAPPIEPGYWPIHFQHWSDRDVGQAIMWAWAFTSVTGDGRFTELIDEVAKVIFHVASMRLLHSSDPRNAVEFEERARVKTSIADNPGESE